MGYPTTGASVTIEAFVRSLSPRDTPEQEAVLDRLERLKTDGVIEGYSVHVVGRELCPECAQKTVPGDFLCRRLAAFREWATHSGRSLSAFFEHTKDRSLVDDDVYTAVEWPSIAIAEFVDGDLAYVAPSTDGERVVSPTDRLETIASPPARPRVKPP